MTFDDIKVGGLYRLSGSYVFHTNNGSNIHTKKNSIVLIIDKTYEGGNDYIYFLYKDIPLRWGWGLTSTWLIPV